MGDEGARLDVAASTPIYSHALEATAPYRDPLYAIVRVEPDGSIHIEGVESQWVGPTPSELGYLQAHGPGLPLAGASLRPGIATRRLPPP